jgi:hypothetical protein
MSDDNFIDVAWSRPNHNLNYFTLMEAAVNRAQNVNNNLLHTFLVHFKCYILCEQEGPMVTFIHEVT